MDILEKLAILSDAAKYDVSCSSSGVGRGGESGKTGSAAACGICHSFAADGRCISLLKVLMSNACIYDCKYCVNRVSADTPRTSFTPEELAELTIQFYRRNYIEGLFLSSGVLRDPDHTMERLIMTVELLREKYGFNGYIHVKTIPGCDPALVDKLGLLADRMSVNIELPTEASLLRLAPQKSPKAVIDPMERIHSVIRANLEERKAFRHAPRFVPGGQSTQMIVGASPDSDLKILRLSQGLYRKYSLKRVYYSAYTPVVEDEHLPSLLSEPPLLREHRLYQADWLMRFYGFSAEEIVSPKHPNLSLILDPKCSWALRNIDRFPVEVNRASYESLLRVPGIGVKGAQRIMQARRAGSLDFTGLKKLGIVLKRARYFITCRGKCDDNVVIRPDVITRSLLSKRELEMLPAICGGQLRFEDVPEIAQITGQRRSEEFLIDATSTVGEEYGKRNEFGVCV
ncbi:MAG: putative DNA modification/repair radical SAM protein [Clostridiales bacterium]|nr:putative DNA modification/repair radical SAM protein [Clostridiales bacterium]